MKTLKTIFTASMIITVLIIMTSSVQQPKQQGHWEAPKWADTLRNPLKNNLEATAAGKIIYNKLCVVCHGDKGKGDGPAGIALTPRPADHTSAHVQSMSDGALYWIITNGKAPMPTYKLVLKENERWQLVNYIHDLGKPTSTKPKK